MSARVCLVLLAIGVAAPPPAVAQSRTTPTAESGLLAEGWASLARGDAARAARFASDALARDPNSDAALALAIDADVARGGSSTALNTYERWLAGRKVENAYSLRRVARAVLREASKQGSTRAEALRALAVDHDSEALAALTEPGAADPVRDALVLASTGEEEAVKRLLSQLHSTPGGKSLIIVALADSGNTLAVPDLTALLADPNDVNRAAAAEALGRLGAAEAIPELRQMLKDPLPNVRLKAAGALYRLNDPSGLPLLTTLASNEYASVRVAAAREMSSHPDANWQSLVRTLAEDQDPVVRLEAARLIAPFDGSLAHSVLDGLARDGNAGIREAASTTLTERVETDFAALRALLRSEDVGVRVAAAGRILQLTR
jgi:HEAT repeat protein